jgi:hypothetical protein
VSALTVLFDQSDTIILAKAPKIDRSVPTTTETEHISSRRNSPSKSRAQNSDGSAKRFFVMRERNSLLDQCAMIVQNNRVGVRGSNGEVITLRTPVELALQTLNTAYRVSRAPLALGRHDRYPRRRPRLRLLPDDDLHVLVERGQERHQPLHREAVELVVRQRGHLRLVDAELLGRGGLGQPPGAQFVANLTSA